MKKKLSLTEKISLAENNAVDFMHACVTIALHRGAGLWSQAPERLT